MRKACGYIALLSLCLAGCDHYGWANRPAQQGAEAGQEALRVETIRLGAHRGLDASALSSFFVERLQRRGLRAVRWGSAVEDAASLRCAMDLRSAGAARALRAEATLRCELRDGLGVARSLQTRGQYLASPGQESTDVLETALDRRRVEERAGFDALEKMSARVALALR